MYKERPRYMGFTIKALNNQIKRSIDQREDANKPGCGLTGMQHGVLGFLAHNSKQRDIFQKDVEAEFNIRRSTATGILQLMEKNGFITREPVAHDARLKKLVLTEKAWQHHAIATREIAALEKKLCAGLSDTEIETFYSIVDKMMKNLS